MDVAVVERIVMLRPRSGAAGFSVHRQSEDLKVRKAGRRIARLVGVVVADRGPEDGLTQEGRIHVEDRALVLGVEAAIVGVVAEHQPEVRVARPGEVAVRVAHGRGAGTGGAGVSEDPDAGGLDRPRGRSREDRPRWRRAGQRWSSAIRGAC